MKLSKTIKPAGRVLLVIAALLAAVAAIKVGLNSHHRQRLHGIADRYQLSQPWTKTARDDWQTPFCPIPSACTGRVHHRWQSPRPPTLAMMVTAAESASYQNIRFGSGEFQIQLSSELLADPVWAGLEATGAGQVTITPLLEAYGRDPNLRRIWLDCLPELAAKKNPWQCSFEADYAGRNIRITPGRVIDSQAWGITVTAH